MNTPARVYQQVWSGLIRSGDGKAERIGGFARGRLHPTQKPVGVTAEILKDFSDEGCVVFDGYLGSGTTLIAAEKTNRILYGMEIESYYCDVICKRYYEFTDDIPTLESTGESFPMQ
jgi:DNA modification methylase